MVKDKMMSSFAHHNLKTWTPADELRAVAMQRSFAIAGVYVCGCTDRAGGGP